MATQSHTHWKKLNNPLFLGAYEFEPGQEITATIAYVKQELVTGAEGKKEQCIVAHFQESNLKPLILNATNCKTISGLFKSPYIEDWGGKKISMHVEQVRAFGDMVDAVRVMKKLSTKAAAPIKCESCGKNIEGMTGFTAEQVAATNKSRYGKCLCIECGKKRKAELEAEQAKVEETPTVEPENDLAAQLMAAAK